MPFVLDNNLKKEIETILFDILQVIIPGFSIAIVNEENIIYSRGFGIKNREKQLPATSNTLYGIASCTKSFTCCAILQLAQANKLSLDDSIDRYLPINLEDKRITIRHLMTHSSGIPDLGTGKIIGKQEGIIDHPSIRVPDISLKNREEFYQFLSDVEDEIYYNPGEEYYYCNEGYILLGQIIEKVSGKKYERYITERILHPLDMRESSFGEDTSITHEHLSVPYFMMPFRNYNHPILLPRKYYYGLVSNLTNPAGGLISSVVELSNYLIMLLNAGQYKQEQILDNSNIKDMFHPFISVVHPTLLEIVPLNLHYGYGWIIDDNLGTRIVYHLGNRGMSSAYLILLPELKIGMTIASNSGFLPEELIAPLVITLCKDKIRPPDQAPDSLSDPYSPASKVPFQITGHYQSYKGVSTCQILKKDGKLFFERPENQLNFSQPSIPLIPIKKSLTDNEFYCYLETSFGKPIFRFNKKENGDVFFNEQNPFESPVFHRTR